MSAKQSDSQATNETPVDPSIVGPDEALEYLSQVFRDPRSDWRSKQAASQGILVYWQGRMQSQTHEALVTILSALMGQYLAAQEIAEEAAAQPDPHLAVEDLG